MKTMIILAILLVACVSQAWEICGNVDTHQDLLRIGTRFQLAMRESKTMTGTPTYGCLLWCPTTSGDIKWAFSVSEISPFEARDVARLSINSCSGTCRGAAKAVDRCSLD